MAPSDVTVFICVSCTAEGARDEKPGDDVFDAVSAALGQDTDIQIKPVDCLAVCKRPCTVALSGPDRWTYVVGDITEAHAGDVIAAARSYAATANGIIPWRERPQCFRKGVISRVPPLTFRPEEQGL